MFNRTPFVVSVIISFYGLITVRAFNILEFWKAIEGNPQRRRLQRRLTCFFCFAKSLLVPWNLLNAQKPNFRLSLNSHPLWVTLYVVSLLYAKFTWFTKILMIIQSKISIKNSHRFSCNEDTTWYNCKISFWSKWNNYDHFFLLFLWIIPRFVLIKIKSLYDFREIYYFRW